MTYKELLEPYDVIDVYKLLWYDYILYPGHKAHFQSTGMSMDQKNQQLVDWEQLFSVAPCGLMLIDHHAVIRFINPFAQNLIGVEQPETIIGRSLPEALPAWKESPFYASLPSLLSGQSTFESVEFDVPGSDKKRLRTSAACVPAAGQERTRWVLLTIIEATEVATLERRLHRAEYQASIGKLARGIAHELNSPLDGVLRYTHLAIEQISENSPVREYLLHVKEGLERMVRAVKAFLEFSRQVTTPLNRIADLNRLIDDVLLLVQHRAKFQQIRIVKQLDSTLPPVIDGGLQHAVVNIVKNAFDAMPHGGTLTVSTGRNGSHLHLDIEDTGSGIPEEIRSRIFEPFFSTKPIHQGNGLGLIIAKEVVERSGGTIEFTSQVGAGTRFRIHIPLSLADEKPDGP